MGIVENVYELLENDVVEQKEEYAWDLEVMFAFELISGIVARQRV